MAIPRGGLFAAGMLAYLLDLGRDQVVGAAQALDRHRPVLLVDDLAVSGTRVAAALDRLGHREVSVALLAAPPPLIDAVAAEPGVRACLTAYDVEVLPSPGGTAQFADEWQRRLPGRRLWIGHVRPVSFPWGEPDVVQVDPETGGLLVGGHRSDPTDCLEARTALGIPGPPRRSPGHRLPDGATWEVTDPDTPTIRIRRGDGTAAELSSTAADMWRALLAHDDDAGAVRWLIERYDADEAVMRRDLAAFRDRLHHAGLIASDGP